MLDKEISFILSSREILFVGILLGICFVWCAIFFIISIRNGEKQDEKCTRKCIHMLRKDFLYMGVIASIAVVLLLTLTFASDGNAVNYFSFAGMLSSIILSVVAIFMTINSENQSKEAKIQLDKSVEKMEDTAKKIEQASEKLNELICKILPEFEKLQKSFDKLQEQNSELSEKMDNIKTTINIGKSGNRWDTSRREDQ